MPSLSILAEPPVTVVDKVVDKHGTRAVAEAYLKFLYTPEGQEIAAKHYYRPRNADVAGQARGDSSRSIELFTIDELFGGWAKAQAHALRRRRHVRPDRTSRKPGGSLSAASQAPGSGVQARAACAARLRPDAGLHR